MTSAATTAAPTPPRSGLGRISQTQWIVISMILGVVIGYLFPDRPEGVSGFEASDLQVLSNVFLRMIKSLIVPLLFATLVVGIAGHGDDMKRVGKLAFRSILYFEIVTTLALAVGLLAVNIVKPGRGVNISAASSEAGAELAKTHTTFAGVVEHTVPQSFFDAAAKNEVLQVVFFAIIFAVALSQVQGPAKTFMLSFCESLSEVMFKFVGIVMKFAPFGIGAAIAVTVGKSGLGVLRNLGVLVLTLYGALIVFVLFVLLPVAIAFKVPIRRFWEKTKEPWLIAFTTASSEAALPLALQNMEKLGVPRRIVSFVLPTGYSFNLDGSTLYLALASVFVAQAAGIDMPISTQILMMLTLMLTSKGVAAVPRASLVILSGALAQFGLPLQGVAVILGVDALMDMARTSINLVGNCLATVVMARWEGSFDTPGSDMPVTDALSGAPLSMPVVREGGERPFGA
ncbi:MAG: cation:dicarboxylase symporter family transporter [Gemmatimonadaceae bacterium]|nr:cation:dicarboxylase symporter family transporter [Gemmatimonadaceae bacterium]NUO93889.1 cation:dicarboxylase symporter family transporter [Gemmatimonadaceae bacterium]NUP56148.1 cation:dicarboxylase symporter family transporter [Gemmatimonadaceae bacterium]NUP70970.1 cation:dicarboxylase symporter family transporter [Gemmatimonadaceae bacterium]NUS31532.1 cation:dicarboxylase symporter family transporter [Gemmatimonadaceae bacterium]